MANHVIASHRLYNLSITHSKLEKPEEIVKSLGAVQAQDYMQAIWAIGLRTGSAGIADIEQAVSARRLVLTWTLRGTIHFAPPEDVKWMIQLTAPRVLGQAKKRLAQVELDDATLIRCRRIIYNALKGGRQIERSVLLQLLEAEGIQTKNQRGYHILWHCAYQGLICFGPMHGKQQTFVLLDEWLLHSRELSYTESMAELALRYFTSHGPATLQDFAWWTGMTLADARIGLDAVKQNLLSEQMDGCEYWMPDSVALLTNENTGVHLLAGFDEFIIGYKDRSVVLTPETTPLVIPGKNGIFLPTLVIDGHVMGTWKRTIKKKGVEVLMAPFEQLGDRQEEVAQAAERYASFLGLPLLRIDFCRIQDYGANETF